MSFFMVKKLYSKTKGRTGCIRPCLCGCIGYRFVRRRVVPEELLPPEREEPVRERDELRPSEEDPELLLRLFPERLDRDDWLLEPNPCLPVLPDDESELLLRERRPLPDELLEEDPLLVDERPDDERLLPDERLEVLRLLPAERPRFVPERLLPEEELPLVDCPDAFLRCSVDRLPPADRLEVRRLLLPDERPRPVPDPVLLPDERPEEEPERLLPDDERPLVNCPEESRCCPPERLLPERE